MGEAALVNQDAAEGRNLLEELDLGGVPVFVALWAHDVGLDAWWLVIAISRAATRTETYSKIQNAIDERDLALSLARIILVFDTHPLIGTIRQFADDSSSDVVEIPLGGAEIGGISVDKGFIYRSEALRFEDAVVAALNRVRPTGAIIRRARTLTFADGFDFDLVVDSGERALIIRAKALKRPISGRDVRRLTKLNDDTLRYYWHATLLIISRSGFSREAEQAIGETAEYQQLGEHRRRVYLIKWAGPEDDEELRSIISRIF